MSTKDLIKRMSASQSVKPQQLVKSTIVEPEKIKVEVMSLTGKETAQERIEKEAAKIESTSNELKEKLESICKQLTYLKAKYVEVQDVLEIILQENTETSAKVSNLDERLTKLEKKSFFQRLFRWR